MGKERLSAKKITIWICVNYGIFVLGFFILGSMGTDKFIVWSNFILDVFLVAVSLALNTAVRKNSALISHIMFWGVYLFCVFNA